MAHEILDGDDTPDANEFLRDIGYLSPEGEYEDAREMFYLAQYERESDEDIAQAWEYLRVKWTAWQITLKERDPDYVIPNFPAKMPRIY